MATTIAMFSPAPGSPSKPLAAMLLVLPLALLLACSGGKKNQTPTELPFFDEENPRTLEVVEGGSVSLEARFTVPEVFDATMDPPQILPIGTDGNGIEGLTTVFTVEDGVAKLDLEADHTAAGTYKIVFTLVAVLDPEKDREPEKTTDRQ